jgi:hypothetical protein
MKRLLSIKSTQGVFGLLMLIFSGAAYRMWLAKGMVIFSSKLSLWGGVLF